MTVFYHFSGGMESAAMLAVEADRIKATGAVVAWADTGKHFPEMYESIRQVEASLGIVVTTVPRRLTFDEFLFEKGGMIRKGTNDCSRRMKRSNLSRHMRTFPRPYEVNLGFNAKERTRADEFSDRNERDWLHWRYPLVEHGVTRERTWEICERAGFSIIVAMYRKMGRFDCYFCGNQRPSQALRVVEHYPALADDWIAAEERKGHSFMPVPLRVLKERGCRDDGPGSGCGCFGGDDDFAAELQTEFDLEGAA